MNPSVPSLAGAFDDARNSPHALEWEHGGERTDEMIARLAYDCVLSGLRAIHNFLAAGDENSVALAEVVHATVVEIEHDHIKIMTTGLAREGESDEGDEIVGLEARTISDQNGLQMVCILVSHAWIERALATGSKDIDTDVLALLTGVAIPAVSLTVPRFFSFAITPPDPQVSESPTEPLFDLGTNLPDNVILGAGNLTRAILNGILTPPATDQP